ncbi:dehydrogenase/reductase SDR family protein 7-like [Anthonomus grandis grandis]|uniref:dehydrogenase/reductase SDR family protein 7-like n=1 Tax=Anthonomus grandis grandis TaxID=2921223 RepID=UPI002166B448|nr:dehydrogenase/reductase SDR family protein 7-like [Anthonomus grandis grandis]
MFVLKLAIENKMSELKSLFSNFNIVGPISLAVTIPWIVFKMISSTCLKKGYNDMAGKVVVITGASSGLGEALAHEFYKHGAQVVLCARRRQELERVRTDLLHTHCKDTTHPPIIIPLDLSETKDLANHVDKILSITGRIDILVNNGGISHRGRVKDTSVDVDRRIMAVNYFGTVALTKAVLQDMLKKKQGQIVFISSVQGLVALPERSAYSASKHALQGFCDSLRAEVASDNISVTMVSPGYIKTELSLNALTGSGQTYGEMDKSTESGYSPEYTAEEIVKAVVTKKKEIILCTLLPKIAIFLRRYVPFLYFLVMERRARSASLKELSNKKK